MKRLFVAALATCIAISVSAQQIKFAENGKLKIAQFTDTHIDFSSDFRSTESEKTLSQIEYILESESPDVAIFTGDIVTGAPAKKGWERILELISEHNTPFAVTFGNHDAEQDMSYEQMAKLISSHPLSLNKIEGGMLADDAVEVTGSNSNKVEALLYLFDSHDYSKIKGIGGYGWFTHEQVCNYRKLSSSYTKKNSGKPYPALAFFHIPLPEYGIACDSKHSKKYGIRSETECSGAINTGMYSAFVEMGDVFGSFVGHDHNNDYVAAYQGFAFCYGRFSGYNTTYTDLRRGVRIIELHEGEQVFETWIRERDGIIINHVIFNKTKLSKCE